MTETRTVLYSGKGGVGKTTLAAATAITAAKQGMKTLVLSIDSAHSLADILQQPVGGEPTPIAKVPTLWGLQNNTQQVFAENIPEIQSWLQTLLTVPDMAELLLDEFLVPPGSDELIALAEVSRQIHSQLWDLIVVDCAPSSETLRILTLPYLLKRWLSEHRTQRTLPQQALLHTVKKATNLSAQTLTTLEGITRKVFDTATTIREHPALSIRLVFTPEHAVLAETRRLFTALTLYGYNVDAVIANRLLPQDSHEILNVWYRQQTNVLQEAEQSFGQLRFLTVEQSTAEAYGIDQLHSLGETLFSEQNPAEHLSQPAGIEFDLQASAATVAIPLPAATQHDVAIDRRGDDLHLTVDQKTHILSLPQSFRRYTPKHAERMQTKVVIHFLPIAT